MSEAAPERRNLVAAQRQDIHHGLHGARRTFTTYLTRSSTGARRSSPIGPSPCSLVSATGLSSVALSTPRHAITSRPQPPRKAATGSYSVMKFGLFGAP